MKTGTVFITLLIFSPSAFANPIPIDTLNEVSELLSNPSPQAHCGPEVYCRDLAEAVCNVPKEQRPLSMSARERFPAPPMIEANGKRITDIPATLAHIRSVEDDAFSTLPVTRENLDQLFEETKSSLQNIIRSQVQLSDEVKNQMITNLSGASFMMGSQYLNERIESLTASNPDSPRENIVNSAINEFKDFCSEGGLQVNAFRRGSRLVFCPGLLYAIADSGATSWQKMANALSFTMAHEVGHTISSTSFSDLYSDMGNCYNEISGQRDFWNLRGEETGADFWGIQILSERMRTQGLTNGDALQTIRQATVDFCHMDEDEIYPSGRARINLSFSRNPVIRESLGCDAPSSEAPMCTLRGTFPGR